MLKRDPDRESRRSAVNAGRGMSTAPSVASGGLDSFRRTYRWLNLTLVQQGVWPLLVVVFGAPAVPVALTDLPWYWARLGAPLLAALLALAYLAQRPEGLPSDMAAREAAAGNERDRRIREQAAILLVGLVAAVALLRLIQGPPVPVAKLLAFGAADVAAYQSINFGVVGRSAAPGWGQAAPVALFAVSWGLHDLFLAASSPAQIDLALVFAGGAVLGLAVGGVCWVLRRWPGGYLAAAAFQFLLVYLVLEFLG